jgi:benzoylformate decarboxylase
MDDWLAPAPEPHEHRGARARARRRRRAPTRSTSSATSWPAARAPALVVGAGADDPTLGGLVHLAERLGAPVFQEAFGAGPASARTIPSSPGTSPPGAALRAMLAGHDAILVVGAPVLRQYAYEPGRWSRTARASPSSPTTRRGAPRRRRARRSSRARAVCAALAERVAAARTTAGRRAHAGGARPARPGEPLRAGHVLAALAERLPRDAS